MFSTIRNMLFDRTEGWPTGRFDAIGIWRRIIDENQTDFTRALPTAKLEQMPLFLAEMSRGNFPATARPVPVRPGGSRWAPQEISARSHHRRAVRLPVGELHRVGLLSYFDPIIVSGDHGYRKPDRRLFQLALDGMKVAPQHAMYVGNDMHRDIFGAREAGLTTVMVGSDQGKKAYQDCVPDYTITDLRELLTILG
jgi:putative hydrolase of the HAD superfamily